jgi:hypothetical protein
VLAIARHPPAIAGYQGSHLVDYISTGCVTEHSNGRMLRAASGSASGNAAAHACRIRAQFLPVYGQFVQQVGAQASGIPSLGYQRGAQLDLLMIIEVQHAYRGASLRCDAFDCCPDQTKVVFPAIPPGMKQGGNGARLRIDRGKVAAFMPVAYPAT